jgi:hypothetical protein
MIATTSGAGSVLFKPTQDAIHDSLPLSVSCGWPNASECLFSLLVGLPLRAEVWLTQILALVKAFYGAGSLVWRRSRRVATSAGNSGSKDWRCRMKFFVRVRHGRAMQLCLPLQFFSAPPLICSQLLTHVSQISAQTLPICFPCLPWCPYSRP